MPGSRPSHLWKRLRAGLSWRFKAFRDGLNKRLVLHGPDAFIRAHWPWPLSKPYERRALRIAAPGGGIGDELMCTPIFAEIKRRNPHCHITFICRHPEFFKGHPFVDEVESDKKNRRRSLRLAYNYAVPPPRPLMTLMAECVGLKMDFNEIVPPPLEPGTEIHDAIAAITRPRVVIQPLSSRWTPNKNWPVEYWRELIKLLRAEYSVIEVGTESPFPAGEFGARFYSFAGQTDLSGFAHIISQADVFIGPSSGGMHLANAYKIKSVILFGGYESPEGYRYPRTETFYTPVPCAPCWLTSDCPYALKCLRAIEPPAVFKAVQRMLISSE